MLGRRPCPVQPVQVGVAEQWRQRSALRGTSRAALQRPAFHHPGPQQRADQGQDGPVADAFLDRLHQLVMRNRRKAVGDVGFHHPAAAPPGLIDEHLQGIVRRAPRAEPETARQEIRLEDRLEHDLRGSLHDPVADSRNRQRPLLVRTRLGDEHPPGRQRPVPPLPQFRGQLAEQPGHPVLLSVRQADMVNASSAAVAAHILPRPVQHVPAADLVEQRMEPSCRVGLGRPVKHMLQGSDSVPTDSRQGGPSRDSGTHQSAAPSVRVNEAAALPSPQVVLSCGSTSTTAASDSLPAAAHFPAPHRL